MYYDGNFLIGKVGYFDIGIKMLEDFFVNEVVNDKMELDLVRLIWII